MLKRMSIFDSAKTEFDAAPLRSSYYLVALTAAVFGAIWVVRTPFTVYVLPALYLAFLLYHQWTLVKRSSSRHLAQHIHILVFHLMHVSCSLGYCTLLISLMIVTMTSDGSEHKREFYAAHGDPSQIITSSVGLYWLLLATAWMIISFGTLESWRRHWVKWGMRICSRPADQGS